MRSVNLAQAFKESKEIELIPTNYGLRVNLEERLKSAIEKIFLEPSGDNKQALKGLLFDSLNGLTDSVCHNLGAHCAKLLNKESSEETKTKSKQLLLELYKEYIEETELRCPISLNIFNQPVRFYSKSQNQWSKTYEKECIQKFLDNIKHLPMRFPLGELVLTDSYSLEEEIQNSLKPDEKKASIIKNFICFWGATNFVKIDQYDLEGYILGQINPENFYRLFETRGINTIKMILENCEENYLKKLLSARWHENYIINNRHNLSFPFVVIRMKTFITYALEYNLDKCLFKTLISRVKNNIILKNNLIYMLKLKEDEIQNNTAIERLCNKSLNDKNSKDILLLLIQELPNEMSELLSLNTEFDNPVFNIFLKTSIVTFRKISHHPEPIQAASFCYLLNIFTDNIRDYETSDYQKCLANFKPLLIHLNDIALSNPDCFEENLEAVLQKSAQQMGGTFFFFGIPHDYTEAKQYLRFHSHDSLQKWLEHFKNDINQKSILHNHEDSSFYNLFNELQTTLNPDTSLSSSRVIDSPLLRN